MYPVIIILGRKGWMTDFDFGAPYFMLAVAVSCLVVLLVYLGRYFGKLAFLPKIAALLVSVIAFFNAAAYLIYFMYIKRPLWQQICSLYWRPIPAKHGNL